MSAERLSDYEVGNIARTSPHETPAARRLILLAREVQELRHLRDNVLPDLRQELDNANACIEHELVVDLTERLRRADTALTTLTVEVEAKSGPDARLRGKLEGVRLALSYLAEMTTEAQA